MAKAADTGKKPGAENRKSPPPRTTKSASGSGKAAKTPAKTAKQGSVTPNDPIRYRVIKAFICLALALFSLIGCFTREGWFIGFFRTFIQGLVGKGFFFLPPILIYCALILLCVRHKPLGGRITCALLLSVTIGAMFHLFGSTAEPAWNWGILGYLYDTGTLTGSAGSGGAVAGFFAICFRSLFNTVGAAIVLVLGTVFLLFAALDVTISSMAERSRERAQQKAEEWKLMREQEQLRAEERRKAAQRELEAREAAAAEEQRIAAAAAKETK